MATTPKRTASNLLRIAKPKKRKMSFGSNNLAQTRAETRRLPSLIKRK